LSPVELTKDKRCAKEFVDEVEVLAAEVLWPVLADSDAFFESYLRVLTWFILDDVLDYFLGLIERLGR